MSPRPPLLAPTWLADLAWESPRLLPGVMALAGGLLLAVALFYLPQLRPPRGRRGWVLPALRAAALLALVVSLLRPVARRPRTDAERGAVLILLDHSRSMAVRDTQRTTAQWVALADALGRLRPGARGRPLEAFDAALAETRQRLDALAAAEHDLDFARLSGHDRQAPTAQAQAALADVNRAARALLDGRATFGKASPRMAALVGEFQALLANPRPGGRAGPRPRGRPGSNRCAGSWTPSPPPPLTSRPPPTARCTTPTPTSAPPAPASRF